MYLLALGAGAVAGLLMPGVAAPLEAAVNPVLAALLYVTFLGVPFTRVAEAIRDWRFLTTALVVNFAVVPCVVFAVTRPLESQPALLAGALVVLLAPCIDYVIVFTGLAGGAQERLVAIAPVLMLGQLLLLPIYLAILADREVVEGIDPAPFVWAFVILIAVPLLAAWLTQRAGTRSERARSVERAIPRLMVPLMALTLIVVVASQIGGVKDQLPALAGLVPVYLGFAIVMVPLGMLAARLARLDVGASRALVMTGVTRNSLVVLPLVLALPASFALAPLAVVTQTLVELVVMVVLVRVVPVLIRA